MGAKPTTAVLIGPFPSPVHGVSIINAKLAERMAARGIAVKRIDLSPGKLQRGLAYHGLRAARTLGGLARLLTGRHRCIMSVDGGIGLIYNIVLALGARLTGQALLLYHHSTRYVLADSVLMRILLGVAGRDVPHAFCSPRMAELFRSRYGASGTAIIVNNAVWIDETQPGEGTAQGLRLGFLSTLTLEKGLGRAIATLRQARQRGLNAELVLAGALVDAQAMDMVQQAQADLGPALVHCGVLQGAAKAAFYRGLDVFLFPSLYPHETQSLVVPEALAAGTPVIAHDHRFVGEILGGGGLLVAATAPFADAAADWIASGRDENVRQARRNAARRQFGTEQAQAAGQVDRLIAWAGGA